MTQWHMQQIYFTENKLFELLNAARNQIGGEKRSTTVPYQNYGSGAAYGALSELDYYRRMKTGLTSEHTFILS